MRQNLQISLKRFAGCLGGRPRLQRPRVKYRTASFTPQSRCRRPVASPPPPTFPLQNTWFVKFNRTRVRFGGCDQHPLRELRRRRENPCRPSQPTRLTRPGCFTKVCDCTHPVYTTLLVRFRLFTRRADVEKRPRSALFRVFRRKNRSRGAERRSVPRSTSRHPRGMTVLSVPRRFLMVYDQDPSIYLTCSACARLVTRRGRRRLGTVVAARQPPSRFQKPLATWSTERRSAEFDRPGNYPSHRHLLTSPWHAKVMHSRQQARHTWRYTLSSLMPGLVPSFALSP